MIILQVSKRWYVSEPKLNCCSNAHIAHVAHAGLLLLHQFTARAQSSSLQCTVFIVSNASSGAGPPLLPVSVAALVVCCCDGRHLNGLLNILLIRMFCRHLFPFVPLAGLAAVASVLCVLSILVFNDENHSAWLSPTIKCYGCNVTNSILCLFLCFLLQSVFLDTRKNEIV